MIDWNRFKMDIMASSRFKDLVDGVKLDKLVAAGPMQPAVWPEEDLEEVAKWVNDISPDEPVPRVLREYLAPLR